MPHTKTQGSPLLTFLRFIFKRACAIKRYTPIRVYTQHNGSRGKFLASTADAGPGGARQEAGGSTTVGGSRAVGEHIAGCAA